jgi:hypothetical protein
MTTGTAGVPVPNPREYTVARRQQTEAFAEGARSNVIVVLLLRRRPEIHSMLEVLGGW